MCAYNPSTVYSNPRDGKSALGERGERERERERGRPPPKPLHSKQQQQHTSSSKGLSRRALRTEERPGESCCWIIEVHSGNSSAALGICKWFSFIGIWSQRFSRSPIRCWSWQRGRRPRVLKSLTVHHTHVCFCEKWRHPIGVMACYTVQTVCLSPYTYHTPKLSPHRRLCILLSQKNSLCMIYKHFEIWGHGVMSS